MNVVLWILAGALAAFFLFAGLSKLAQPKKKLAATPNMGWAEDFSPGLIKTVGALEVLAAIGLILPAVFDIVTVLVPLAASGLVVLMGSAALTHARRNEGRAIATNLVLLVLAAIVAWGRFGPHAF
ncbi:DoxX family protein [Glycomyces buryatensis]|uniref:DoxX family protein n=1 Tax=Glycomyces buryatensis TaxID=2570927 RepID=A0A4S8PTC2_9ACTN|nr:DoxX family protein [Glycomyces buryatensis]THV34670.1 DoxX family protein [Glycomyces buryatensis]